ncbi:MAG: efflux RND transporter periplasmic adaptor subunit [Bacteroidetes bacterium]|nr:efflux RND transporter periplasmic adaptor subunit [Bacteroidota bacterium]
MKITSKKTFQFVVLLAFIGFLSLSSCKNVAKKEKAKESIESADEHEALEELTEGKAVLTVPQRESIKLKIDTLQKREMSGFIKTNGVLEISPKYRAIITSFVEANVKAINVFQGDKVRKGQVLAVLEHPSIIQLQQDYVKAYNNKQYLEKEFDRQKMLYEKQVGAGKTYQKVTADYKTALATYNGLKMKLEMIHLNTEKIENGELSNELPILSTIDGVVNDITISLGSFVDAQTPLFSISNTKKVHADLTVYEKDINRIKIGQVVRIQIANNGRKALYAKIFAIGKSVQTENRSVLVHAHFEKGIEDLVVGSYLNGSIITDNTLSKVVPEEAIVSDGGKQYIFVYNSAISKQLHDDRWAFDMVEVISGVEDGGYVAINILEKLDADAKIVQNKAYYLLSDMQKSEAKHSH